jgi:hypothetical protein
VNYSNEARTTQANDSNQLAPDRHPNGISSLPIFSVGRSKMTDCMEHPFSASQKKPDYPIRRYEHNGVPGMATIWIKCADLCQSVSLVEG